VSAAGADRHERRVAMFGRGIGGRSESLPLGWELDGD